MQAGSRQAPEMVMLWGCHRTSAPMSPMTSANLHEQVGVAEATSRLCGQTGVFAIQAEC